MLMRSVYRSSKRILLDAVGLIYPLWKTIDTLETDADIDISSLPPEKLQQLQSEHVQWKSYWVVYTLVRLLDYLAPVTSVVPMFDSGRILFLTWCQHPSTCGALKLHEWVFKYYWRRGNHRVLAERVRSWIFKNGGHGDDDNGSPEGSLLSLSSSPSDSQPRLNASDGGFTPGFGSSAIASDFRQWDLAGFQTTRVKPSIARLLGVHMMPPSPEKRNHKQPVNMSDRDSPISDVSL
jgi:hypothetical protein